MHWTKFNMWHDDLEIIGGSTNILTISFFWYSTCFSSTSTANLHQRNRSTYIPSSRHANQRNRQSEADKIQLLSGVLIRLYTTRLSLFVQRRKANMANSTEQSYVWAHLNSFASTIHVHRRRRAMRQTDVSIIAKWVCIHGTPWYLLLCFLHMFKCGAPGCCAGRRCHMIFRVRRVNIS